MLHFLFPYLTHNTSCPAPQLVQRELAQRIKAALLTSANTWSSMQASLRHFCVQHHQRVLKTHWDTNLQCPAPNAPQVPKIRNSRNRRDSNKTIIIFSVTRPGDWSGQGWVSVLISVVDLIRFWLGQLSDYYNSDHLSARMHILYRCIKTKLTLIRGVSITQMTSGQRNWG